MSRRRVIRIFTFCAIFVVSLTPALVHGAVADDPLPSWNDGDTTRAIVDFVQRVITPSASGPTTANPTSASSTKRWMKPLRRAG
jgi:hypothetical protein